MMLPKPPAKQPKQRKPIQRTRVRTRRTKARPGRLKGEGMSVLRNESWQERKGLCLYCGLAVCEQSGDLAHVRGKRMWGDTKENTAPAHKECHRKFHQFGPSGVKPVLAKERADV